MRVIAKLNNKNIHSDEFGGKAAGLYILKQNYLSVPDTVLISASCGTEDLNNTVFLSKLRECMAEFLYNGMYNVAIRSSSTNEDAFNDSKAGHYKSILGRMSFTQVIENIGEVIRSLDGKDDADARMGIIIQEKIDADFSGVIFSSNPLNYSKNEMVITYVDGIGEALVAGSACGHDILVRITDNKYILPDDKCPNSELLLELCHKTKKLELTLGYPVDIEWAVLNDSIYFLQCRPLTSITRIPETIRKVVINELEDLPFQLVSHDKIQLRLLAKQNDVMISDAYISILNNSRPDTVQVSEIKRSSHCKGYSCVITYPEKVSDKVVRSFVGDGRNVAGSVSNCCRYGIRSYPPYSDLFKCIKSYGEKIAEDYWIGAVIIQEIYSPLYTGIIQKTESGYLIEITKGHFLTKGIVPASEYMIDKIGRILLRKEVDQYSWFEIIEGHVIRCICNDDDSPKVSLSDGNIKFIVEYFKKILETNANVVEFGLLEEKNGIQPYLIDFVNEEESVGLNASDISEGIISHGRIFGKIVHLDSIDDNSMNIHFHDENTHTNQINNNIIIFCERPDISLLSFINQYNPRNIGCVFEDGSVLCHLAVVLRERGIPAVKIGTFSKLQYSDGEDILLDAASPGLVGRERVIVGK